MRPTTLMWKLLREVGLEDWSHRVVDSLEYRKSRSQFVRDNHRVLEKYADLHEHQALVRGVPVRFSTEDAFSKRWFYPRYLDGALHEEAATVRILDALDRGPFVDVGANLGWFSCVVRKLRPDCEVHAFEMDELNFELLECNLRLNRGEGPGTATAHHRAVGAAPGVVRYRRRTEDGSAAYRLSNEGVPAHGHEVEVEMVTLDDVFGAKDVLPEVMKIDVEGAELGVLRGMAGILARGYPKHVFLEVHPQFLPEFGTDEREVLGILAEHDYSLSRIVGFRESGVGRLEPITADATIEPDTMVVAVTD